MLSLNKGRKSGKGNAFVCEQQNAFVFELYSNGSLEGPVYDVQGVHH